MDIFLTSLWTFITSDRRKGEWKARWADFALFTGVGRECRGSLWTWEEWGRTGRFEGAKGCCYTVAHSIWRVPWNN